MQPPLTPRTSARSSENLVWPLDQPLVSDVVKDASNRSLARGTAPVVPVVPLQRDKVLDQLQDTKVVSEPAPLTGPNSSRVSQDRGRAVSVDGSENTLSIT